MKNIIIVFFLLCFVSFGLAQINLSASLTACYGLNGNGNEPINNLTATLSAVTPTVNRLGNPNSAFAFNGSDLSFIKLPNSPLLKPTRVSFSCWLKLDALPSNYNIIVFAQNNCSSFYEGYAMGIRNVGGLRKFGIAKSSNACSEFSQSVLECNWGAAAQTWYHLGFYIGSDSMKVYVNGALNVSLVNTNPIDYDPTLNLYLGGTATSPNGPLLGSMDNVRFYNRKLSDAEFNQLYTQDPACIAASTVDIRKNNADQYLSFFPNPTAGKFVIELSEPIKNEINIYNVLGDVILKTNAEGEQVKIDLSDQPNGVYFVELKVPGKVVVKKIIKE